MAFISKRCFSVFFLSICFFLEVSCQVETIILDHTSSQVDVEKIEDNLNDPQSDDSNTFHMTPLIQLENWTGMQGGAIIDDLLVCLTATDWGGIPNGFIYNLQKGERVCSLLFNSSFENKRYYMPHANQVSFGKYFLDDKSAFPLLYVSQVNGGNGRNDIRGERGVLVYDLEKTGDDEYYPRLLQAIIPDLTDSTLMKKIGAYTPNYIVDTDNNQFVIIGYPNNSWYDLSGAQPIAIMPIPDIKVGKEYVFSDKDIIDSYTLPKTIGPQQSFYYKGMVFSSGGDTGQASIRVIDLKKKEVVYYMDMTSITSGEPQFLGIWGEKMVYYEYGSSGQMYEINIPGFTFN